MELSIKIKKLGGDCQGGSCGPAGVSLSWIGSLLDPWHVVVNIVHILVVVLGECQGHWDLNGFVELRFKPLAGVQEKIPGAAVGLGRLVDMNAQYQ